MPTGFQSGQPGNAVPLTGEAEMRLASSGLDALTITGHSSMSTAADFLVLRSYVPEGTTGGATEKFVIGSSGSIRLHKRSLQLGSTASTAPTLGASQSGQVWSFGGFDTGIRVLLPAPVRGLNYTIIQASGCSGPVAVSATRGTNAEIRAPSAGGSQLSTALVVAAPSSVAGMAAVFVAISTLTWQMFPAINGVQGASAVGADPSGMWTSEAA